MDGRPLDVEVAQIAPPECPMLRVAVSDSSLAPSAKPVVMSALARLLGLDHCLAGFYRVAPATPCSMTWHRLFAG